MQHAQENEAIAKRRQEELARGEQEAKRLQQMEATKKPSGSADLPSYESLGFSLPPPPPPQPDEQEEEYVDESGQQEEEDARLAREMMEREEREAQRRVRLKCMVSWIELNVNYYYFLIHREGNRNWQIL